MNGDVMERHIKALWNQSEEQRDETFLIHDSFERSQVLKAVEEGVNRATLYDMLRKLEERAGGFAFKAGYMMAYSEMLDGINPWKVEGVQ